MSFSIVWHTLNLFCWFNTLQVLYLLSSFFGSITFSIESLLMCFIQKYFLFSIFVMVERNKINFEQIFRKLKFDLVWSDFQLFIVIFLVTALCFNAEETENGEKQSMKNGPILDIKIWLYNLTPKIPKNQQNRCFLLTFIDFYVNIHLLHTPFSLFSI